MSKRVENVAANAEGHRAERTHATSEGAAGEIVIYFGKILHWPNGQCAKSHFLVAVDAADGTLLSSRAAPEQSWDASEFLREVATLGRLHGAPRTIFGGHGCGWMTGAVGRVSSEFGFELRSMRRNYLSSMAARVERALRNADAFRNRQRRPWESEPVEVYTAPPDT